MATQEIEQKAEQLVARITLTEEEFCQRVGISRTTAHAMRNAGRLSYCRVGRRVFYLPRHVDEFLAQCEERRREG